MSSMIISERSSPFCSHPEAASRRLPLVGGVTTTDEMFILIGSYYIDDTLLEPPPIPPTPPVVQPSSFCGLIGLELLGLWPLAVWLRRRGVTSLRS